MHVNNFNIERNRKTLLPFTLQQMFDDFPNFFQIFKVFLFLEAGEIWQVA